MNRMPADSQLLSASDRSSRTTEILQPKQSTANKTAASQTRLVLKEDLDFPHNSRFVEFFRLLAEIDGTEGEGQVFPKKCRVCEQVFQRFPEYLRSTTPKGHVFEDCKDVMGIPFTMMYRHCPCGNTLVLSLTEQIFPALDLMWSMLHDEATASGLPLQHVVKEFARQCEQYILRRHYPRTRATKR